MRYKLFVVKQAVGADLVYFDLFHLSTSTKILTLESVLPVVSGAVAVTGVVGVDLHLTRTTAVGTGGTAATVEGTDKAATTITTFNRSTTSPLPFLSARLTPSGGATAGALLSYRSYFSEETNAGTYLPIDLVQPGRPFLVPAGTGIRVVQGAVASVGNVGFDVTFDLE
jgi:hypothetical protein